VLVGAVRIQDAEVRIGEVRILFAQSRSSMVGGSQISVSDVVEAMVEFAPWGGASPSLVAWQLMCNEAQTETAWAQAHAAGLIEPAGRRDLDGHEVWRLVERESKAA
jgi:hypothetical protein